MLLLAIPYSTNVERVTLALGHKGLDAEIEMVEKRGDRARVREVSGQELVPVMIDGDTVIADSTAILGHLELRFPEPPLLPAEPRARAEAVVFVQWFNTVWKGPPNSIDLTACWRTARIFTARVSVWPTASHSRFSSTPRCRRSMRTTIVSTGSSSITWRSTGVIRGCVTGSSASTPCPVAAGPCNPAGLRDRLARIPCGRWPASSH